MQNQFVTFLEDIKAGKNISLDMLPTELSRRIIDWYSCFVGKCPDINKAIDLLYYFYIHENLDLYSIDEYVLQCNNLFQIYSLPREKVLYAFTSFRSLVYGD
ncbi:MAG TPA: hypothetical protein VFC84_15225 [Desulfosporosinus sp.]|nr:hypothetical protein [Desulfosporosinus sp.]